MDNNASFNYTYSAVRNQEVQAIRKKYLPPEEDKLDELKRLDRLVQTSGVAQALCAGITGCLIFGLGMCMAMEVIGGGQLMGVAVSLVGAAVMLPAYPIQRTLYNKKKAELTPRILQLAAELSGEG